ncbi:MAG: heme-binding protein, partial [Gammaproteobacteria bacterium]|nr:heme-binding protein [Gammaproteobacteria bacterium]
ALESLGYEVIREYEDFELRQYPAHLVAETLVDGPMNEASNTAFRRLFDYISGANRAGGKVAMTTPVTVSEAGPDNPGQGEKIAMTAPVVTAPGGSGPDGELRYAVQFVMPAEYERETLPVPVDDSVKLREIAPRTVAVHRYRGSWSEQRYRERVERLRSALTAAGLEVTGEPELARYDPPFMPWFMRRNEVLIEIAAPAAAADGRAS